MLSTNNEDIKQDSKKDKGEETQNVSIKDVTWSLTSHGAKVN